MEKINLVELLKDCPKGMELDCTMFDNVTFVRVDNGRKQFPIEIAVSGLRSKYLTKEGCFHDNTLLTEAKCVIFPKGKTTWEGFVPPSRFKDGDIIYNRRQKKICIYYLCEDEVPRINGCRYNESNIQLQFEKLEYPIPIAMQDYRFATEEEKQRLFDSIKANGYKWNDETKTLEKLIEPKFKVGNRIKKKDSNEDIVLITDIADNYYIVETKYGMEVTISINIQNNYELVPNKFDITIFKPFDKVLVRDNNEQKWTIDYFSFVNKEQVYPFVCVGHYVSQCIPYEGNEHLLGTTNDCDEFYKTW